MEQKHTNNELAILIENVARQNEEYHENQAKVLNRIESQVQRTNGRVTRLEQWKWMMAGAISIITAVILPIIFLLLKNLSL